MGGWSENWRVILNSTQDQVEVEVEVGVELGNRNLEQNGHLKFLPQPPSV